VLKARTCAAISRAIAMENCAISWQASLSNLWHAMFRLGLFRKWLVDDSCMTKEIS
jgi:hypothetical protein